MGLFLVIISFIALTPANAETLEQWHNNLLKNIGSEQRITFGVTEITGNESDAIEKAKLIAKTEMIKTFKIKLMSSSIQESTYKQSTEKSDSTKMYLQNSIQETTEDIELVGLDLSNIHLDAKQGLVEAAALLNLKEFGKYLNTKISSLLKKTEAVSPKLNCQSPQELQNQRRRYRLLTDVDRYEQIIITFDSKYLPVASQKLEEQIATNRSCRKMWNVILKEATNDLNESIKEIFDKSDYLFTNVAKRKPSSNKTISIYINKELSKPENLFGKVNLTGLVKIKVIVDSTGDEFIWKSNTLRQAEASLDSTNQKINLRLNDLALKGIETIFEEHL